MKLEMRYGESEFLALDLVREPNHGRYSRGSDGEGERKYMGIATGWPVVWA